MNHKYNRKLNESVKEAIRRVVLKENMVAGGHPGYTVPTTPGQSQETYPSIPQQPPPIAPSFNPNLPPITIPPEYPASTHPPPYGPNGPLRGRQRTINGTDYWFAPGVGYPYFYWDPAGGYPAGSGGWAPIMS